MTFVVGPRCRRISLSAPVATTLPSLTGIYAEQRDNRHFPFRQRTHWHPCQSEPTLEPGKFLDAHIVFR